MEQRSAQDMRQKLLQVLQHSMQFRGITPSRLHRIAAVSQFQQWHAGQHLYDIGEPSEAIYCILSGNAEYAYAPDAGARKLGTHIEAGDIAGWAALLKTRPSRPGKVVAQTDVEAAVIPADALADIFRDNPIEWKTIISRFATMVSRDYSVPADYPEIQQEIEELESGAYAMEKQLMRQKLAGTQPARRRITPAERFYLIQVELSRMADRIEYNPRKLDQAWRAAEAEVDSMFDVELPVVNTNNLPNWG